MALALHSIGYAFQARIEKIEYKGRFGVYIRIKNIRTKFPNYSDLKKKLTYLVY